jgi:hypothetical protein
MLYKLEARGWRIRGGSGLSAKLARQTPLFLDLIHNILDIESEENDTWSLSIDSRGMQRFGFEKMRGG